MFCGLRVQQHVPLLRRRIGGTRKPRNSYSKSTGNQVDPCTVRTIYDDEFTPRKFTRPRGKILLRAWNPLWHGCQLVIMYSVEILGDKWANSYHQMYFNNMAAMLKPLAEVYIFVKKWGWLTEFTSWHQSKAESLLNLYFRYTATLIVGRFSDWIKEHQNHIQPLVEFNYSFQIARSFLYPRWPSLWMD